MQLSEYFTVAEFEESRRARELGIANKMDAMHIAAAKDLCKFVLVPLRKKYGVIKITSGFRSKALNTAVRGETTSQHNQGKAADIVSATVRPLDLFKYIIHHLPFDQCIYETDHDKGAIWVHVSYNGAKNRFQALRGDRKNGKTTYKPFTG